MGEEAQIDLGIEMEMEMGERRAVVLVGYGVPRYAL